MHAKECFGVSRHHKGELVQSAWKRMNKSVCEGMSVNSRCPMDEVCWENFIIGLAGGKPMIAIRGWKKQFQTKGDFVLDTTLFFQ